jgi:hypothetical protein
MNSSVVRMPPPPTPGPSPRATLEVTARDRFAGMVFVSKEPDKDLADYLSEYDHWEEYSEQKSYSKRPYQAAYKGSLRQYVQYLCVVSQETGENQYYVAAKRLRTELEALEEFCPCSRCTGYLTIVTQQMWCPHCTGCIKAGAGFARSEHINSAKARKAGTIPEQQTPYVIYGTATVAMLLMAKIIYYFLF